MTMLEQALQTRTLLLREVLVIGLLYSAKTNSKHRAAFITTTGPVPMGSDDNAGPWGPNPNRIIPTGSTLKIVMVARRGDCGLTDRLDQHNGYEVRLNWESALMSDIRLTEEPTK